MTTEMTMVYWRSDEFRLGKLIEHPEIMTQGRTIEELEANLRDAYVSVALEDVPAEHLLKTITIDPE